MVKMLAVRIDWFPKPRPMISDRTSLRLTVRSRASINGSCNNLGLFLEDGIGMDNIIHHSIALTSGPDSAFEFFTVNKHLQKWLTNLADVEAKIGGKYELFWNLDDKENDSTVGCKVLAIALNRFLCFEWKGPRQFKHFMNDVRPLTNVIVFFVPTPEGTEIHLLHTGWRDTTEWEEAREWFDKAWATALSKLQNYATQT